MTSKIGPRCPAIMRPDARPKLAAVAAAAMADKPVPPTDWQCTREPHAVDGPTHAVHLALPLGVTGPSVRFDDLAAGPCPTCSGPIRETVGMVCQTCGRDYGQRPEPEPAGPEIVHADPDDVRRLIELVDRPGTTAVVVHDGDELLLLLPDESDPAHTAAATRALTQLFPTVTFLLLSGVTGVVLMPKRQKPQASYANMVAAYEHLIAQRDALIMQGVNPDDLTLPHPPANPNAN